MDDDYEGEGMKSAMASIPSLQPNPKLKGVTQDQLSKFQELHRRRLQIKSRSNIRKKTKGAAGKSQSKYMDIRNQMSEADCSKLSNSSIDVREKSVHDQKDSPNTLLPSKKQQKLHWGLGIKEPWERKANM